jgi:hypothetical protein
MGSITWTSWTQHAARGKGRVWIDDCQPDCAGGRFSSRPMTIVLSAPRGGKFHHFALRYRSHGKTFVDRRSIRRYPGGFWTYEIGF